MIKLSQQRTKTLLAIHGWSAVWLGLLLYAVVVTGVASVFADEIAGWSSPLAAEVENPFPAGTDAALRRVADSIDPSYREELFFFPRAGGSLYAFFHRHETGADGKPHERGVAVEIDPLTLRELDRREGWDEEIEAGDTRNALAQFMIEMHVRLHVPNPWGLLLTGVLGLAMLVAAISGFLTHRHLIRELFTLRRGRDGDTQVKLLATRDKHVIGGSWNLPFAFILAFTGSYFSFAGAFGIPVMAMVAFGGDQEKMIETIVGNPSQADTTARPLANLDAVIADVRERSHAEPSFLMVQNWGRADALITAFMKPREGRLAGPTYVYSGTDGAFQREKPVLGLVPSSGSMLVDLMAPLHFGHFAGVLSKTVWFALGFASAYVIVTGLNLWTQRRWDQRGWRQLARATQWVGYGLPLALIGTAYAFFPLRAAGAAVQGPMMQTFLAVAAVTALLAWTLPRVELIRAVLVGTTGLALLGLPVLRMFCGGPDWSQAIAQNLHGIAALDVLLLLAGVLCLLLLRRRPQPAAATLAEQTS